MGQKDGKKWTAAAALQPTNSKSDRLLGSLACTAPALNQRAAIKGHGFTWGVLASKLKILTCAPPSKVIMGMATKTVSVPCESTCAELIKVLFWVRTSACLF